jgi:hypothetical protein
MENTAFLRQRGVPQNQQAHYLQIMEQVVISTCDQELAMLGIGTGVFS